MKIKYYILTFFMLLSGVAFGQDSIVNKVISDSIIIRLSGVHSKPNYIHVNKYFLSQTEKDSIFSTVFSDDKTQQLLKSYKNRNREDILLVENQFNLVSVLVSDLIDIETKKSLLIAKIRFDQKRLLPPMEYIDYGYCPVGRDIGKTIITINSKDKAIEDFVKSYNDERFVNFSEMVMVFSRKNKKIKNKDTITAVDKKIARIQKTKIEKLNLLVGNASTALYSKKGMYGLLIIDYKK